MVSALDHEREVRRVRWRDDGLALELVVAPPDEDSAEEPFTHGFAVVLEREDWHSVAGRSVTARELTGPQVEAGPRPDGAEEAVRDTVTALCDARDTWWSLRRQVWAVEALADGRVLAALEGTKLESWLPSGKLEWSVPDPDGGRQLHVCPGQESAWVNVAHPRRWNGAFWESIRSTVEQLSLADGRTLSTAEVAFPAVLTADLDGRIALRNTRRDEPKSPIVLLSPEHRRQSGDVVLGGYDSLNHYFPVRYSPELLFLQGGKTECWKDKWIVSVVPPTDGGAPEIRRLFPLEWDAVRHRHLYGGPAVRLADNDSEGNSEGGALVHAGGFHLPQPQRAFIVRRRFPDGTPQWLFTADHPVTALDTDGETLIAALTSGEVIALDAADGTLRWSTRLEVDGVPTVPLSLAMAGPRGLLIGTVDGRILVCETGAA